jgi:hypothetical protein
MQHHLVVRVCDGHGPHACLHGRLLVGSPAATPLVGFNLRVGDPIVLVFFRDNGSIADGRGIRIFRKQAQMMFGIWKVYKGTGIFIEVIILDQRREG